MIISLTSTSNKFSQSWRIKFSVKYILFQVKFFFLLFVLLVSSCWEQEKLHTAREENKPSYTKPVSILLDTMPLPRVTYLKNVPPPPVMLIPQSQIDLYNQQIDTLNEENGVSSPVNKIVGVPIPHFTNINTEQGLLLSSITSSIIDKKGNLWFGTAGGGVTRYDGTRFTNFTNKYGFLGNIRCILEDKNGNIWFGTDGSGVICYDGISFKSITMEQGLADNIVFCMANDKDGNIYIGTYTGGLSFYDGTKFTTYNTSHGLPSNNVNSITKDKKGNLWFGTFGGGVCRYDPIKGWGGIKIFRKEQGLPNDNVIHITEDSKGIIWISTYEGGVSRFDPSQDNVIFESLTKADGLGDNTIRWITEDDAGNIWFATQNGGITCYDPELMRVLSNYTTDQGLASNSVFNITKDKSGNLWFGTMGGGISRYNGKTLQSFSPGHGLAGGPITNIAEDKHGRLWIGSAGGGLSVYDGKYSANFATKQGLGDNIVYCVAEDIEGNIWVGTMAGGTSRLKETSRGIELTNYSVEQGLASNTVLNVHQDKKGNHWFATQSSGVIRFDGSSFTNYSTAQGLALNDVRTIAEDKDGFLWFGTAGGGASHFDGKHITTFNTDQGLAGNIVLKIKRDKSGNLWFGTQGGGISRYDGSGFISFTSVDGLADDIVYDIVEDNEGVIWMGTNQGFSGLKFKSTEQNVQNGGLKGAGLFDVSNEQLKEYEPVWENFNVKNGYPVKDLNEGSLCVTRFGLPFADNKNAIAIWAGSGDLKLIRFDPSALQKNTEPLSVYIHSISIDESPVNWYGLGRIDADSTVIAQQETMVFGKSLNKKNRDSLHGKFRDIHFDSISPFYQVPQNLVLPYRHNRVSFDFGAIETNRPFMVRYQFILEGYDKEWSPVTDKTVATYGNINEGSYTFKLKALSPEGIWSEPINYIFRVLPPWYRSWWAYGLYAVVFITLITAFVRWRTKNLLQQKLLLEEKVNTRTVQLQKSLDNLKTTQSQLIQSEKMASLGELTAGIAHEIQNPLNFVNNFSEVSAELVADLKAELKSGNIDVAINITDDIDQNLDKINHHGKRADAIVKGMLQHSRTSTGVNEPTDINALAEEYLRLAYQGIRARDNTFNANLETDFDKTIDRVNIIPQDMGRVLLNLYNNAFYAVAEKGKQSIENYEPLVIVRTKKSGNKFEISVTDNGIGIQEKIKEKIFQPFFTTKPTGQGTGLGLSLSYDIVKAHGGEFKVDSKEGEGTEFKIILSI